MRPASYDQTVSAEVGKNPDKNKGGTDMDM
jgi:hypothetical protein